MPTNLLTRQQLEIINRKTIGYPLQIAEKDYYLALAIQLVANSPLNEKLIFKGGTALHHCYLPQYRFSEDLDFTALDKSITLQEIQDTLEQDGIFKVNKVYQSDFSIKIERLQYQGVLGQAGNIKFEVDIHQQVILPAKPTPYQNVWRVNTSPNTMDAIEITAEKIRATAQRARYRDFYDLYFLLEIVSTPLEKIISLVKQKEVRTPITVENVLRNWSIAKEQKQDDLASIFCSEDVPNSKINKLLEKLNFPDILPGK